MEIREFVAEKSERVDVFLAKMLKNSRSQVATLIKNGFVSVNLAPIKASFLLKNGDVVRVRLPQAAKKAAKFTPKFDVAVLYEDDDVAVLSKPPNVVVHSAASVKEATLVDWLLARGCALSNLSGQSRAGLVHRLDKGTSGAIIIAKNNGAHEALSKELAQHTLGRFYLAITNLPLKENALCVEKSIARCPKNRLKKIAINAGVAGLDGAFKKARKAKSFFVNVLCESAFNDEKSVNSLDKFTKNGEKIHTNFAKSTQKNDEKIDMNSQKMSGILFEKADENLAQNCGENLLENESKISAKNHCEKSQENSQNSVEFYGFSRDEIREFLSLKNENFNTQNADKKSQKSLENSQFLQEIHTQNFTEIHAQNANENSQNFAITPQEIHSKFCKANSKNSIEIHAKNSQNFAINSQEIHAKNPPKIPSKNINLIAAKLFTGRTHQIRAHLESLNRHILGDTLYGYKGVAAPRVMLHSYILYFEHPKTRRKIFVKAPIYKDFEAILREKFTQKEIDEATSFSAFMRHFAGI